MTLKKYLVLKSTEYIQQLKSIEINNNMILSTTDVTYVFTNIPKERVNGINKLIL